MAAEPRSSGEAPPSGGDAGSTPAEQSIEAFRAALEASVTISRERLQEVVDDAVRRGRMTRGDGEELLGSLLTRGREGVDDIIGQLDRLLSQLREDVEERTAKQRRNAVRTADRAKRELDDATERARQEVGSRAEGARERARRALNRSRPDG